MDDELARLIAAQLREPEGEGGRKIAEAMVDSNARITARALDALAAEPGEVIIELGPATGRLSHAMVESLGPGGSYTGVELSEDMAAAAEQTLSGAGPSVEIVHADCMEVELPEQRADGVMAVNVVYFVDDIGALFERVYRWLKPGGRAVFGVRSDVAMSALPFVVYGFRKRSLDEMFVRLSDAGLIEITASYEDEGVVTLDELELPVDSIIVTARRPLRVVL